MKSNRTLYGSLAIALLVLALVGGRVVKDIVATQRDAAERGHSGATGNGELPADANAPTVAGVVVRSAAPPGSESLTAPSTGGYWDDTRGAVRFRIAGEVFDASSGRPITSFGLRIAPAARAGSGLAKDVTNADGQFLAEGIAAGTWEITVRATGYAPSKQSVVLSVPTDDPYVVFPLSAGAGLTGLVVDWRGEPVEGAEVVLSQGGSTKSDTKGAFVLKSVPEDDAFTLTASHPRFGSAMVPDLRVAEGASEYVKLTLSGILRVTGHVYRGSERTPAAGVMVKSGETATMTDPAGAYEIFIPLGERPMVRVITGTPPVELESYPDSRGSEPVRWVTAKTHVAELVKDFYLAMETARLHGRVSDASDAPVASARLLIANTMGWAKRDHETFPAETTTDGLGRYVVDNIPAHAGYRLTVLRDGRERLLGTVAIEEPRDVEANFVLATGTLKGRFVDAKTHDAFPMQQRMCDGIGAARVGESALYPLHCAGDGTFDVEELPAGRYRVDLIGNRMHQMSITAAEADVPSRDLMEITVSGERLTEWTARVTDSNGTFVSGLMVRYITGRTTITSSLHISDQGTATFTAGQSQASVFIEAPGYEPASVELTGRNPRQVIDVRLERVR